MCSRPAGRLFLGLIIGIVLSTGGRILFTGSATAISSKTTSASILVTVAPRYERAAWLHSGDRFPRGAKIVEIDGSRTRQIVQNFVASADPAISFDGARILFAGRRLPGEPWQIWEASLADNREPHLIVSCSADCIRPFYLPDQRIVYAHKIDGHFVMETAQISGTGTPLQLTYGPGDFLPSDVLRDGRILFEAGFPLGGNTTSDLYTVYSDGSGVESYRCDHRFSRYGGTQVASGDVVFASSRQLARFTSSLAHELRLHAPEGDYDGEMAETASGGWVLPWRPNAHSVYSLQQWSLSTGELCQVFADPEANVVQPVLLASRAVPNRHPSGLHKWPYANLLCLNAYITKDKPVSGSFAMVRLYEIDDRGKARALGTSPVQIDGSFFVRVPGNRPLQIELLDAAGHTLSREKGWFWMRAGEQRICVGCHAGPERAPENTFPRALQGLAEPVNLAGASALKPPSQSGAGGR